jgi:hypothetical protein
MMRLAAGAFSRGLYTALSTRVEILTDCFYVLTRYRGCPYT